MGITAGKADGRYEVDGPDPENENSHSMRVERGEDAEKASQEAAEKRAEAAAAQTEADALARADHHQVIETSDPSNPQDALGAVAGTEDKPSTLSEAKDKASEDAKEDAPAEDAPKSGMKSGDDPADFGAPEVREHMQRSGAKERKRVVEAEKQGKNRKTVVEFKPED